MGVIQDIKPVTWSAADGHRSALEKLTAPALDTPLGLVLLVLALLVFAWVDAAADEAAKHAWPGLAFQIAVTGFLVVGRYAKRSLALVRHRRATASGE